MTVRRIAPDEGALLREVRLRALQLEPAAFCATLEEARVLPPEIWAQRAEQAIFVVSDGVRFRGMTGIREQGEIWGVFLEAPLRGQGLGRTMLDQAVAWARAAGLREVTLEVNAELEAALALYRKAGFHLDGREDRLKDGRLMLGWTLPLA